METPNTQEQEGTETTQEGGVPSVLGEEILQNGQNRDIFDDEDEEVTEVQVPEDDWIERALATIRVRNFVMDIALGEDRAEQERTKVAKAKFLEVYEKTMGTITLACDQAGVSRQTFYNWLKDDANFRSAVNVVNENRVDQVEDRLLKLIQMDDGPSIRFFIDRKSPAYKKTSKLELEVGAGARSLEEQLYDIARKRKEEAESKEKQP